MNDSARRAAVDMSIVIVASFLNFHKYGKDYWYLPGTGGRFMSAGNAASDHCGHNDFQVEGDGSPRYLIIATGSEGSRLHVCPDAHLYVR